MSLPMKQLIFALAIATSSWHMVAAVESVVLEAVKVETIPAPIEAPVDELIAEAKLIAEAVPEAPIEVPVAASVEVPIAAPVEVPIAAPVEVPIAAPVEVPIAAFADAPIAAFADAPIAAPVEVPIATPADAPAPVEAPIAVEKQFAGEEMEPADEMDSDSLEPAMQAAAEAPGAEEAIEVSALTKWLTQFKPAKKLEVANEGPISVTQQFKAETYGYAFTYLVTGIMLIMSPLACQKGRGKHGANKA
ncbi:hypothetical protein T492DRAFT_1094766 [Pavlovales sp. CCMP2436]|nr:hypothetical protein T492DRAFT_1094766 [Pavlovales sp. CCMP2436]